jgi:hypothetical protein
VSDFSAEINAKTGGTSDLSSVISKYDADGNGELDKSEQEAMNKEKALEKLVASGMSLQIQMMGEPLPAFALGVEQGGDGSWDSGELTQYINISTVNDVTGSHLAPEEWFAKIDEEKAAVETAAAETVQYEA